jgi:hypothetical protein
MENGKLFDDNNFFSTDKIFIEIIKISYDIDYEYLFNSLKLVSYDEYCKIRKKVMSAAVKNMSVVDTEVAKQKYWERIVLQLESKFNFQKPKSYKRDAERMRIKRGGF